MNTDLIIQALGMIVLPVLGLIIGKILNIGKDLNEHKLHVSDSYVKKVDLEGALTKIEKTLENIFNRLNTMADRRYTDKDDNNGI